MGFTEKAWPFRPFRIASSIYRINPEKKKNIPKTISRYHIYIYIYIYHTHTHTYIYIYHMNIANGRNHNFRSPFWTGLICFWHFWEACHLSPSCSSTWWTELWNHLGDLSPAYVGHRWIRRGQLAEFAHNRVMEHTVPICSMYGIFTYIWVIFRVNVGKYSIHGAYGVGDWPVLTYWNFTMCATNFGVQLTLYNCT